MVPGGGGGGAGGARQSISSRLSHRIASERPLSADRPPWCNAGGSFNLHARTRVTAAA